MEGAGENEAGRGRWLSLRRLALLLGVVAVVAGLLVWVVIPYLQELQKFESLELTSYWWTRNAAGTISLATIRLRNNGTKTVRLTAVFVNTTRIPTTQWNTQYASIPPDTSDWTYIAPAGVGFLEDAIYNLTIHSAGGGTWTFLVPVDPQHLGPELFTLRSVSFHDWRVVGQPLFAYVCVVNDHETTPVVVVERYVNGTRLDPEAFWITPYRYIKDTLCIPCIFNWVENVTYTLTLETACGNTHTYTKTAVE
jgi:hypothetical protein